MSLQVASFQADFSCIFGVWFSMGNFLVKNSSGGKRFLCGHNIIHHDAKYIHREMADDALNNPLNDSIKAMELFYDEVNVFQNLDELQKDIYADLLCQREEFRGFFSFVNYFPRGDASSRIKSYYYGKICSNSDVERIVEQYPVEIAYVLAMLSEKDTASIIPNWVNIKFPAVSNVIRLLRNTVCAPKCPYCRNELDIHRRLKQIFGYDDFRGAGRRGVSGCAFFPEVYGGYREE